MGQTSRTYGGKSRVNTLRHVTLVPSKDTKIANVKFDKKTWKMGFSRMAWDTGCPPSK